MYEEDPYVWNAAGLAEQRKCRATRARHGECESHPETHAERDRSWNHPSAWFGNQPGTQPNSGGPQGNARDSQWQSHGSPESHSGRFNNHSSQCDDDRDSQGEGYGSPESRSRRFQNTCS